MKYRRSKQPGGSYFFTVVTYRRRPLFSLPENIERLRAALEKEIEKHPSLPAREARSARRVVRGRRRRERLAEVAKGP